MLKFPWSKLIGWWTSQRYARSLEFTELISIIIGMNLSSFTYIFIPGRQECNLNHSGDLRFDWRILFSPPSPLEISQMILANILSEKNLKWEYSPSQITRISVASRFSALCFVTFKWCEPSVVGRKQCREVGETVSSICSACVASRQFDKSWLFTWDSSHNGWKAARFQISIKEYQPSGCSLIKCCSA